MRIALEQLFTPRAKRIPSPVPLLQKATSSSSSCATWDVSADAELYLLSRPERSTSTTPAILSSGNCMGLAKSFVKTGGAETAGEDATGLGMDATIVINPELGVQHSAAKAAVAYHTMVLWWEMGGILLSAGAWRGEQQAACKGMPEKKKKERGMSDVVSAAS